MTLAPGYRAYLPSLRQGAFGESGMGSNMSKGDRRPVRQCGVRVGHLFLDLSRRQLLWLNDTARELHHEGVPLVPGDLSRQPLLTLDGEPVGPLDLPLVRACRERTPQHSAFLWKGKDDITWQVDWTASPTRDEDDRLAGVLATITLTAPEPDWEILAGLTHDLRTPLQAVQLSTQLLDDAGDLSDDLADLVFGLRTAAQRAMAVSRDLFDWCRTPASNGRRVERVFLALAPLLNSLMAEHAPAAQAKGLALVNRALGEVHGWEVATDPVRMGRLLSNLLTNAIRYTRAGRVELLAQWRIPPPVNDHAVPFASSESAIRRRPALVLSVVDTGVGISPDEQESIFQPFRHGKEAPQHDSNASGLGLSIVERLAEELGFLLEAYSEPGHGTAFDVVIPGRLLKAPKPSLTK